MKKIALALLVVIATSALTGCYWGPHGGGHHPRYMNEQTN